MEERTIWLFNTPSLFTIIMSLDKSRTIQMNEYCPADDTDKNILEKIQGEINAFHGNKR